MTIHSFKSERQKNMLLGVGFICLVVLWLASILFKTKLSDKTLIADLVPESLTYITISALFGLVGAIVTALRCSAFFKIVVAQSCFKQPLFAPARVSRAAPDLASRHR